LRDNNEKRKDMKRWTECLYKRTGFWGATAPLS